jgi:hypothetical protein
MASGQSLRVVLYKARIGIALEGASCARPLAMLTSMGKQDAFGGNYATQGKEEKGKRDDDWYRKDDVWIDLFEWLFSEDDTYADKAALLCHRLIAEFEQPNGVNNVKTALEYGRRYAFTHSGFAHECKLFIKSLDERQPLIGEIKKRKPTP